MQVTKIRNLRRSSLAVAGVALLFAACAGPERYGARLAGPAELDAARRAAARSAGVDWNALERDEVGALQEWLRIRSVNPPGQELDAASWLAARLSAEGIEARVEEAAAGRHSVVARLRGAGRRPPVLLVSHLDVVPVDEGEWEHPPFGGELVNGEIWGRGAIDDKGPSLMDAFALIALKRAGIILDRDVVFLCTADEEAGGKSGVKALLERHPELRGAEAALVTDGSYAVTIQGMRVLPVGTAEKASVAVRIVLDGRGGHASVPGPEQPLRRLAAAMERLASASQDSRLEVEVVEMLGRLGARQGGVQGWMMQHATWPGIQPLVLGSLGKDPALGAMIHATVAWSALNAGVKYNVIPGHAEALVDMRILPGTDPERALEWIRRTADLPDARIDVLEKVTPTRSPLESRWVRLIDAVTAQRAPDTLVTPILIFGGTDGRHLRPAGIPSYVVVPAYVDRSILETAHGKNERIPVATLAEGMRNTFELLLASDDAKETP